MLSQPVRGARPFRRQPGSFRLWFTRLPTGWIGQEKTLRWVTADGKPPAVAVDHTGECATSGGLVAIRVEQRESVLPVLPEVQTGFAIGSDRAAVCARNPEQQRSLPGDSTSRPATAKVHRDHPVAAWFAPGRPATLPPSVIGEMDESFQGRSVPSYSWSSILGCC
jgi:hypothetical protein